MKLSMADTAAHEKCEALLALTRPLNEDEVEFVFSNWRPEASHNINRDKAFFTPDDLAQHLAIVVGESGVFYDLCAGIGALTCAVYSSIATGHFGRLPDPVKKFVLIEKNPDFIRVGRRLLPDPRVVWVEGDIFDRELLRHVVAEHGYATWAYSNPPFGSVPKGSAGWLSFRGPADLMVAEVALRISRGGGVFLLSQTSCPFRLSGQRQHQYLPEEHWPDHLQRFMKLFPGIDIRNPLAIDTAEFEWRCAKPKIELADIDVRNGCRDLRLPLGLDAAAPSAKPRRCTPVVRASPRAAEHTPALRRARSKPAPVETKVEVETQEFVQTSFA